MLNFEFHLIILPTVAEHNEFGKLGEETAKNYLEQKGYDIICTNYKAGKLEIDIIARAENFIVFAEVKTRNSSEIIEPEAAVNRKKQKQIIKAADIYLSENNINTEARFDIITVLNTDKGFVISHIEDAFYPTLYKGI